MINKTHFKKLIISAANMLDNSEMCNNFSLIYGMGGVYTNHYLTDLSNAIVGVVITWNLSHNIMQLIHQYIS